MKVYYSGNFRGHTAYESACDVISLNSFFQYGGYDWFIPNIYTCSQGIVIDICHKIPFEVYDTFYQKWSKIDQKNLTDEQLSDIQFENPMSISIAFEVVVNGLIAHSHGWSAIGWQPCSPDFNNEETETLMTAYSLDRKDAWNIYRMRITWPMEIREEIKSLSIKFSTNRESHSCNKHFTCKPDCEPFDVEVLHPVNGEYYLLHVLSCQQDRLLEHFLSDEENEYPKCFCNLQYSTEPVLPTDQIIMVQDCTKSDQPVIKAANDGSRLNDVCAIGVIGGSHGPAACFIGNAEGDIKARNSCSSLHFEPVQEVEWFISIQITPCETKQIDLL